MGHDIGMAKYYLADNIKQEYSKFDKALMTFDGLL